MGIALLPRIVLLVDTFETSGSEAEVPPIDKSSRIELRSFIVTTVASMPRSKSRGGFKNRQRGRGGGGGGRGGRGGGGNRPYEDTRVSFDKVNKHNENFERYYNTLIPAGEERDRFWAALRRELPNSFRFTGSKGHALSVRDDLVSRFFPKMSKITDDQGNAIALPTSMPWYPGGLAYTMTTPKNVIRRYGPFKHFQKFLVSETGVGNISRQEQVSMIPPLLLDVKPEHTVLDLCAAPGSKSAQLVELIHAGEEERVAHAIQGTKDGDVTVEDTMDDYGRTTGLVIANDVDYKRAHLLIHQVKRLNSPNLLVTNHDASMYPSILVPNDAKTGSKVLKFDRILADVPCSGDGTCRKNPGIWKDWSPQNSLGLFVVQTRILTRSLQMLKVGGRVVYSTCSMNPMEDEAVVASAIERCGGSAKIKLLDVSKELPDLIRSPGMTDWSIMNKSGKIYESWPEAEQFEGETSKIVPGMFPPDEVEKIPLQHCMRLYPHQQDTGGFFVAVIEKQVEFTAKPEDQSKCSKRDWKFVQPEPAKVTFVAVIEKQVEFTAKPEDQSKCSKRDWKFVQPEPAKVTAFSELKADIESDLNVNGALVNTSPEATRLGAALDVSAAARQNTDPSEDANGVGAKRKLVDEEPVAGISALKKPRLGDEPDDLITTSDTLPREHADLPPADAMAVEADGAEPGSQVPLEKNGDNAVSSQVADAAADAPFDDKVPGATLEPPRKRRREDDQAGEEAFKYLNPEHEELESIYNFYNLHPSFPRDRFLVRNPEGNPVKGIYYTSKLAKDILVTNEGRSMKFVHGGVKMFMKQDAQGQDICRWRIQTEGLPIIDGWVGDERTVTLKKKSTLRKLLVEMFLKVGSADDENAGWHQLGEIGPRVRDMGMGCCVLRVQASNDDEGFDHEFTLPLWRSLHSLNLMLPKEDRKAMILRIFDEDIELVNHSAEGKKAAEVRSGAAGNGSVSAQADAEATQEKTKALEANGKLVREEIEEAEVAQQNAAEKEKLDADEGTEQVDVDMGDGSEKTALGNQAGADQMP
nr:multisite-specific trna:(cytosine-c(5))-methyltransferase trm4a [Quercus suber]